MLKKSLLHTITVSAALLLSACGGGDADYGAAYGQMSACQQGCLDSSCSEVSGCPALFNCITSCGEDESCQGSCMNNASALSRAAMVSAMMCVANSCEGGVEVEIDQCATCLAGTACGQEQSCEALFGCMQACGANESCNTNCKDSKEQSLVTSAESAMNSCTNACSAE